MAGLQNKLRIMLIFELLIIGLALTVLWAYLLWMNSQVNLKGATLVQQVPCRKEEIYGIEYPTGQVQEEG